MELVDCGGGGDNVLRLETKIEQSCVVNLSKLFLQFVLFLFFNSTLVRKRVGLVDL